MALMKIVPLRRLSKTDYDRIERRSAGGYESIVADVKRAMETVRTRGDAALVEANVKAHGRGEYVPLQVTVDEASEARARAGDDLREALAQMIKNIRVVHEAQLPVVREPTVCPEPGIQVWREWRPLDSVGLYIPGGGAVYPSSVLMSAIPAQIAGCPQIILCSPPRDEGQIPAPTLVAAEMIGVTAIYKVGGVEAIAAMTYGTESVPAVAKICGAGNSYVTAAKMLARDVTSIDMPAGPSEIFIIADETADPAFIAADLLADAEHGEDSACVLVTTSRAVAERTAREIERQASTLATGERARISLERFGLIALVDSLDQAVDFANAYGPEHLELMTDAAESVVAGVRHAGSIFLGPWTSKASGDYATGANHVLPTGGMARMYPPLGVESFGKWMQVQCCTKDGLARIRRTIETIADVEQLPAHKNSTAVRFKETENG